MAKQKTAPRTEPAHSIFYEPQNLIKPVVVSLTEETINRITPALEFPLNQRQEQAFHKSFHDRVSLVWGPPGTGKTTVLATIILGWLEDAQKNGRNVRICIGASNYKAFDNVLEDTISLYQNHKLKNNFVGDFASFYRVRGDYADSIENNVIIDVSPSSNEWETLPQELNTPKMSIVVAGTWTQLNKLAESNSDDEKPVAPWFDLIIIDESSQMDVATAGAYFLLMSENANLVLAGDDKQLGPIYPFAPPKTSGALFDCIFTFIKEVHRIQPTALNENYRSNEEIICWVRNRFYSDFSPFNPNQRLNLPSLISPGGKPSGWSDNLMWSENYRRILNPDLPIVIITYEPTNHTVSNPFEAQSVTAIAHLYRLYLEQKRKLSTSKILDNDFWKDFWNERLGIVTPHRAQIAAIRNYLIKDANFPLSPAPVVDTVDRFQGQESDLIISSYTVSDHDFVSTEDEFILSPRRFNVTLTRARSKFIMFISTALTNYLPSDRELASQASHLQLFVQEYCSIVEEIELPFTHNAQTSTIKCRLRTIS